MSGTQAPSIRNGAPDGGTIVISHKEYIGPVRSGSANSGADFAAHTFRLNPGDEATFPWLAQISRNFQQYRFEGLCFHYKTMSADALSSTNTALGSVVLSTIYDATQDAPKTKFEMENTEYAQSIKPSQSITHFVETAKSQSTITELYVNQNPATITGDRRFYDFGKFTIATEGMQAAEVILGELWVSYQIRLLKPQLYDAKGNDVGLFHYGSNGSDGASSNTPLGTLDWLTPSEHPNYFLKTNNLEVVFKDSSHVRFSSCYKPSTFLIMMFGLGDSGLLNPTTGFTLTNCVNNSNSILQTNSTYFSNQQNPIFPGTATRFNYIRTVNVDGTFIGKEWGFGWDSQPGLPANLQNYTITVIELPYTTIS